MERDERGVEREAINSVGICGKRHRGPSQLVREKNEEGPNQYIGKGTVKMAKVN